MIRSFLAAFFVLSATRASYAVDVSGTWLTQAGDARVAISHCGVGVCGRIVWLKDPIDRATGKLQTDDKNPDPSLAKRKILGLSILSGMKPNGASWSGSIYNADDGKTYAATITPLGENSLKITGCAGSLCGSETWVRVGQRY